MIYKKDLLIELGYSREFQEFLKKHGALLRFIIARKGRKNNIVNRRLLICAAFFGLLLKKAEHIGKN